MNEIDLEKIELFKKQKSRLGTILSLIDKQIKKAETETLKDGLRLKRSRFYELVYTLDKKTSLLFGLIKGDDLTVPLSEKQYKLWVDSTTIGFCFNMYKAPIHFRNIYNPYREWLYDYQGAMFRLLESGVVFNGEIAEENKQLIDDFNKRKKLVDAILKYDKEFLKKNSTIEELKEIQRDYEIMHENEDTFTVNLNLLIAGFLGKEIFVQESLFL